MDAVRDLGELDGSVLVFGGPCGNLEATEGTYLALLEKAETIADILTIQNLINDVRLEIDGKEVANYLYTDREIDALLQGGVHRLHMANLKTGEHELIAIFTGKGPHSRDYRRGATVMIEKGIGAKYLELEITDRVKKQQPEFVIKEWE